MGLKDTLVRDVVEGEPAPLKKRYPKRPFKRPGNASEFEQSLAEQTRKNLQSMQAAKNRAKGMAYFDSIISGQRLKELQEEKGKGKKIIGFMCALVPQELIIAAGAIPVRLCSGFYDTCDVSEDVLPKEICPLVKSSFGLKLLDMDMFRLCDAIVIPASCDAKKKLGEVLADYMTVFMMDLPSVRDTEKAKKYWLSEVMDLKYCIEKFTGKHIGKKELEPAVRLLYERTKAFRKLYDIRKSPRSVITEKDAMLVTNTAFFDDPARWTQSLKELCSELEENIKKGLEVEDPNAPRILLTGSAIIWPNFKILDVAEKSGLNIVIDQVCSGTEYLYQPAEVDEYTMQDMMAAVAERYLLPSMCPIFFTFDDRADRILEMVQQFGVQGVIYHTLRLCQIFDMETEGIRQALREKGVPILKVITDYSYEDVEQLRTRMEAFREIMQGGQQVSQNANPKKIPNPSKAQKAPKEKA
jgi:benzoyl-CoA reductase/2-hydroxyglutaryl-CoA dehydratase subunit BcrC/BadD/HgdB